MGEGGDEYPPPPGALRPNPHNFASAPVATSSFAGLRRLHRLPHHPPATPRTLLHLPFFLAPSHCFILRSFAAAQR